MKVKKDKALERWEKQQTKISQIASEVFRLRVKVDDNGVLPGVAKFLLTTQLVEFELRLLLLTLGFSKWLKSGEDYISDPGDFDKKRYTLGTLINELSQKYTDAVGVKRLIQRLNKLLDLRNEFTHRLFSASLPIEKINPLAIKGAVLGEVIFGQMLQLEKKVNEKEDKYFVRIKKLKNPSEKEKILSQLWVGKVKEG